MCVSGWGDGDVCVCCLELIVGGDGNNCGIHKREKKSHACLSLKDPCVILEWIKNLQARTRMSLLETKSLYRL